MQQGYALHPLGRVGLTFSMAFAFPNQRMERRRGEASESILSQNKNEDPLALCGVQKLSLLSFQVSNGVNCVHSVFHTHNYIDFEPYLLDLVTFELSCMLSRGQGCQPVDLNGDISVQLKSGNTALHRAPQSLPHQKWCELCAERVSYIRLH